MPGSAVLSRLTPERKLAAPESFTVIDEPILQGLPHAIQLHGDLRLLLVLPTGLLTAWRDADPAVAVSRSDDELAPRDAQPTAPYGDAGRAPPRLLLQLSGVTIAAAALSVGLRAVLPGQGERESRIELIILAWDLRAGSMRGPGSFGSRIAVAWRPADLAIDQFSTPPVNPVLIKRLPPVSRMESRLGLQRAERLLLSKRFLYKRVVLK